MKKCIESVSNLLFMVIVLEVLMGKELKMVICNVMLMTKKMILTIVKLMVRIFIIKPVIAMEMMVKMVVMMRTDD